MTTRGQDDYAAVDNRLSRPARMPDFGPEVSEQFDRLADQDIPLKHCAHVESDGVGRVQRVLTSWSPDTLDCPPCADRSRRRAAQAPGGFVCPGCRFTTTALRTFTLAGPIRLVVGLCAHCSNPDRLTADKDPR